MKKIIIIVVAVVVLLGGAGAGVYFLKPDLLPASIRPKDKNAEHAEAAGDLKDAKDGKKDKAKKKEKGEHEFGADLDVFVVNLAGAGPSRYLRTTLSLGIKDEHEKEKIKELSGKIRDAVIMYLTQRKAEELDGLEGKNKLREELHKQINEAIGDEKLVTNVYFKEFLIQ